MYTLYIFYHSMYVQYTLSVNICGVHSVLRSPYWTPFSHLSLSLCTLDYSLSPVCPQSPYKINLKCCVILSLYSKHYHSPWDPLSLFTGYYKLFNQHYLFFLTKWILSKVFVLLWGIYWWCGVEAPEFGHIMPLGNYVPLPWLLKYEVL